MAGEDDKGIREQENRDALATSRGVEDGHEVVERVQERGERQTQDGDRQEQKVPPRGSKFDDSRQRVAELARERRRAAEGPDEFPIVPADREKAFFGKDVETRSDRQAKLREESGEDQQDREIVKRKLKVNGQDIELTDDEVVAHAQKALAAENLLEVARRERDEGRTLLEQIRAERATLTRPVSEDAPTSKKPDPVTTPDETELDDIVDRIQVGDPKEAKAALQKYGDAIEERIVKRLGNLEQTITDTVDTVNEQRQRQRDTLQLIDGFYKDNPEFSKSSLQSALAHETADIMRAKMREAGVQDKTFEDLKRDRGMNDIQAAGFAYSSLQAMGYSLPKHADLLNEAAKGIRKSFGLAEPSLVKPAPATDVSGRVDRKRDVQQQPRRATAPSTLDRKERTREEARLDAVLRMKAARRGRG